MKIIIDVGHTRDYQREHPDQFNKTAWDTQKGKEIYKLLGFDKDKNDSVEHRLNTILAYSVLNECIKRGIDAEVIDYPELSNSSDISKTITTTNNKKPDLFVSIHANATGQSQWKDMKCGASGTVVLHYPGSSNGKKRARAIADECKKCRKNNGGPDNRFEHISPSSVSVLAKTNCPSVLIETCFYDNVDDLYWTIINKEVLANSIVDGIIKTI